MQSKRSFPKYSRIKKKYLLPLLLIPIIFVLLFLVDTYFTVKTVEVVGVDRSKLRGIQVLSAKNLLFTSEQELEKELAKANPTFTSVKVTKIYPGTVKMVVQIPFPVVSLEVSSGYFFLNMDGKVVARSKEKNNSLPTLKYYQKLNYTNWQSGDLVDYKDILTGLHFLQKATELGLAVDTIDINGLSMIALQINGQKIIFTTEKDRVLQDYQFATIIKQFKIEGKSFAVLDLRFDKPVIQF